jgi:acyl transferase domain-containing protein
MQPRPIEPGLRRPSELAVFSAPSAAALDARVQRLEHFLDQDGTGATLADVCRSVAGGSMRRSM